MKIFITIALTILFITTQNSNAFDDNEVPLVCKHFGITTDIKGNIITTPLEFFGAPLANGFCPGPGGNVHDNNPNTTNKHSSAECYTTLVPLGF